jgi:sigma-B regulation protein RsbU (phosphoserine phosphatase)
LLYTDGLVDAESASGEFYGLQRLCATTQELNRLPASAMVEAIGGSVETHAFGRPSFDDLTLLAVKDVG